MSVLTCLVDLIGTGVLAVLVIIGAARLVEHLAYRSERVAQWLARRRALKAGMRMAVEGDPIVAPGSGLAIDPGVLPMVEFVRSFGLETIESCQGGPGHCADRPFVAFKPEPGREVESATDLLNSAVSSPWPVRELRATPDDDVGLRWELVFDRLCTEPPKGADLYVVHDHVARSSQ